jgi:hypothetical protein
MKIKENFGVFSSSGSIGSKKDETKPIALFDNEYDAKEKAKRLNSILSPGEKTYYKIKYYVKNMNESMRILKDQKVICKEADILLEKGDKIRILKEDMFETIEVTIQFLIRLMSLIEIYVPNDKSLYPLIRKNISYLRSLGIK